MLFQSIPQHLKLRFRKDSVTSKYYCTWPFIIFSSSLILIKMSPSNFKMMMTKNTALMSLVFFPIIHNLPLLELPSSAKNTKSGSEVPIILLKKIVWADNSQARQTQHFVWSGRWGEEKNKAPVSSPLFWLFPRSLYEAIFWHVCLEQSNCHAIMFFWQCCSRSLSFISKCSRIKKEKQKKCLKMFLDCVQLG